MSIRPGTYIIHNAGTSDVLDLSGADSRTIIAFPFHGWQNQQWKFSKLGAGWSIQSVHAQDNGLGFLVPSLSVNGESQKYVITSSAYPIAWNVRPVDVKENGRGTAHQICWQESALVLETRDGSSSTFLAPAARKMGVEESNRQVWFLESRQNTQDLEVLDGLEVLDDSEVLFENDESFDETTTTTVTTTTVTTTVKKKRQ